MRTFHNQATAASPKAGMPLATSHALRELHAQELEQVSGGFSPLGEVLKIVKGGGSVPPKKP